MQPAHAGLSAWAQHWVLLSATYILGVTLMYQCVCVAQGGKLLLSPRVTSQGLLLTLEMLGWLTGGRADWLVKKQR